MWEVANASDWGIVDENVRFYDQKFGGFQDADSGGYGDTVRSGKAGDQFLNVDDGNNQIPATQSPYGALYM